VKLPRADELRRADMIRYLESARRFCIGPYLVWSENEVNREMVFHYLEHFLEAADRISVRFKKACPGIPWRDLVDFRTDLIHEYEHFDPKAAWDFMRDHAPAMLRKLRKTKLSKEE
jgi:uncharacterized protein with HEPN domain